MNLSKWKVGDIIETTGRNGVYYTKLETGLRGLVVEVYDVDCSAKIQWRGYSFCSVHYWLDGRFKIIKQPNDWEADLELV